MNCSQYKLIVFTRYPEPGQTKTRLIPRLGEKGASNLHRQMTETMIEKIKHFVERDFPSIEICFTGGDRKLMHEWLGDDFNYQEQRGAGLGDRMASAFADAFDEGMTQVAIIGTDCPDLSESIIQHAFAALSESDLVLGPAEDGGYYLIGLKQVYTELFTEMAWGTDTILAKTLEIAQKLGLKTALLPVLRDIDRPEDLDAFI